MNYDQIRKEVEFYESTCINSSLLYRQLSAERKMQLMLEAWRGVADDLKLLPTALAARKLLYQKYDSLWCP